MYLDFGSQYKIVTAHAMSGTQAKSASGLGQILAPRTASTAPRSAPSRQQRTTRATTGATQTAVAVDVLQYRVHSVILLTPFVTVSAGVDNRLGGVTRHVGWIDGKQSRGSAPPVLSIFKKGDEVVVDSLAEALEQEHQEIDGGIELFLADPSSDGAQPEQLLRVIAALRRHIYLEEEFVFPRLKAAGTFAAVLVMLREHGEIWRTLDSMESELTADDDAAAAAEVGRTLLTQLEVHNEKEEPIIYSQMDAAITDGPADELRAFLAIGTIPEGWTCAQAGRA